MNPDPDPLPPKICPMCGAPIEPFAEKCQACGEVLTSVAGSDAGSEESLAAEELRAFVGRGADYYLNKWRAAIASKDGGTGFNLAAFVFSGIWLPFRKMYAVTLIFYGIVIAEAIAEQVVFVLIMGEPEVPAGIDRLGDLIAAAVCGAYGNRWYLSHARRTIARLKAEGMPREELLETLARRGGRSYLAAFGCFFLFALLIISFLIVLEIVTGVE